MKRLLPSWNAILILAIFWIASPCAQSPAQEEAEGKVVTIAPDATAGDVEPRTRIVRDPSYWIGIRGSGIESALLRTHLQLAEDMGVVVEEVMPDSPAAKAGLRKHDIILRVNGDAVDNMQVLQSQVSGGKEKPLELKIIRLGKPERIVVVPEVLPEQFSDAASAVERYQGGGNGDLMQQLMQQFGARNFGPGMFFRGGGPRLDLNQIPSGVSVSIQRNNDGPVQITVKQGSKTWHIEGDDEASLLQLPDDVRPYVQRMLNGQRDSQEFGGGGFELGDINKELEALLPRRLGGFGQGAEQQDRLRKRQLHEMELQERLERLEKRLLEMQGRMSDEELVVPIQ